MKIRNPQRVATRLSALAIAVVLAAIACLRWAPRPYSEQFEYYPDGRLKTQKTADERSIHYRYDRSGRLAEISKPGRPVRFGYDLVDNLTHIEDPTGSIAVTYDPLDRVATFCSVFGQTISYEYDPWGHVTSIAVSGGNRIEYERDALGRIITVNDGHGLTTFDYFETKVVRRLPNRVKTTFGLTGHSEPGFVRHELPDGELIAEYRYSRDGQGRVIKIEEFGHEGRHITQYGYDSVGRLATVQLPSGETLSYGYDAIGNRLWERNSGG